MKIERITVDGTPCYSLYIDYDIHYSDNMHNLSDALAYKHKDIWRVSLMYMDFTRHNRLNWYVFNREMLQKSTSDEQSEAITVVLASIMLAVKGIYDVEIASHNVVSALLNTVPELRTRKAIRSISTSMIDRAVALAKLLFV